MVKMMILGLTAFVLGAVTLEWAWPHHSIVFYREGRLQNAFVGPWQGALMMVGGDDCTAFACSAIKR